MGLKIFLSLLVIGMFFLGAYQAQHEDVTVGAGFKKNIVTAAIGVVAFLVLIAL